MRLEARRPVEVCLAATNAAVSIAKARNRQLDIKIGKIGQPMAGTIKLRNQAVESTLKRVFLHPC